MASPDSLDALLAALVLERFGPAPQRGEVVPDPLIRPGSRYADHRAANDLELRRRRRVLADMPADEDPDTTTEVAA